MKSILNEILEGFKKDLFFRYIMYIFIFSFSSLFALAIWMLFFHEWDCLTAFESLKSLGFKSSNVTSPFVSKTIFKATDNFISAPLNILYKVPLQIPKWSENVSYLMPLLSRYSFNFIFCLFSCTFLFIFVKY